MCTTINIKEDLTYNVMCSEHNTINTSYNLNFHQILPSNQNDLQLKLTNYLVESLKILSNKLIGTVLDTTNKS